MDFDSGLGFKELMEKICLFHWLTRVALRNGDKFLQAVIRKFRITEVFRYSRRLLSNPEIRKV